MRREREGERENKLLKGERSDGREKERRRKRKTMRKTRVRRKGGKRYRG